MLPTLSRTAVILTLVAGLQVLPALAVGQEPGAPAAPQIVVKDPVARALVETNPTTPSNLVRVINSLVDLREPAAAAGLLKKLAEVAADDASRAALHDEFGSAMFLKFARQAALNPTAQQLAEKIRIAVEKRARDPERTAQLLAKLKSPAPAVRAAAIGQLSLGGSFAAKALLDALADPEQAVAHAGVREALVALDADVLPTLAGALVGQNAALAQQVAGVLGEMATPEAELYLYAPAFAADAPPELRAAAQRALVRRQSAVRDAPAAAAKLLERAQLLAAQGARQPEKLAQANTWAIGARLILPTSATVRRAQLSIAIAAAGGQAEAIAEILKPEGVAAVEDLLADALERNDATAATWAAWQLGQTGTAELLRNRGSQPSVLVQATRQADRRVRLAAIEAIGRLGVHAAFPGSSYVADGADYLLRSRGHAQAIVGDIRTGIARGRAGLLATHGYEAEVGDEARAVLDLAGRMPDCELIVLDMNLASPTSGQLLTSLRRDARSALTPIVIVSPTVQFDRAVILARQYPRTTAVLDVRSEPGILAVIAAAVAHNSGAILPADERRQYADRMLTWLETNGGDVNDVFPLRRFETALIDALWSRDLSARAAMLVARCGTADGQRALVELINQGTQPLELRQAAATSLAEGIASHGTLLTVRDIQTQYDRYNASGREEKAVQQLLASVLDMVEARAGRAAVQPAAAKPAEASRE